jgi:hypothetical protein
MHIFWVAGLLLALIEFPDFTGSLGRIAGSVEKMAGVETGEEAAEAGKETGSGEPQAKLTTTEPTKPGIVPASKRNC